MDILQTMMADYAKNYVLEKGTHEDYEEWVVKNADTNQKIYVVEEDDNFILYALKPVYGSTNNFELEPVYSTWAFEDAVETAVSFLTPNEI